MTDPTLPARLRACIDYLEAADQTLSRIVANLRANPLADPWADAFLRLRNDIFRCNVRLRNINDTLALNRAFPEPATRVPPQAKGP